VHSFELENLTFQEKYDILSHSKIIFMESGASIVNLYYSNIQNSKIILFTNMANYKLHSTFSTDIELINNITDYKIIPCDMYNNLEIISDNINKPYVINCELLEKFLQY
jgi:hypothetical protein